MEEFLMDVRERIEQANAKAAKVLTKGRPVSYTHLTLPTNSRV